ncbi:hypothetical protein A8F94_00815 [Bacillus sp. FJAT-27225]|uniref:DUF4179 domain-containing protein n=1 Tax=Bacillus sp. FJAT-27225 TaxID=1743144 RepID=UPI00080C3128|nr:DUF4179 domain-containing protein [Bacillus sp. FJAT-27225]OCA90465.1 hypothetical protein A8F94_00815 [Bacillus sp. FJAT-27225]
MDKETILNHLNNAIEEHTPDAWNQIQKKLSQEEDSKGKKVLIEGNFKPQSQKRTLYKRLSIAAAVCLIAVSAFTFTPAMAAIQDIYDKLFSNVDDIGVKAALEQGLGQDADQTYYDEANDITVHLDKVMTDDKETMLLLTYQSGKTNLENLYVDLFEGKSKIYLVGKNNQAKLLKNVGWGSSYYDKKENKRAVALSIESLKHYQGQEVRLMIENLTIWGEDTTHKNYGKAFATVWPLGFKLDQSAVSEREIVALNKEFTFEGITYTIKQVEYTGIETRIVVTGADTKPQVDKDGNVYTTKSKLELQLLNARKIDKKSGYLVNESKVNEGVFLKSGGERVDPNFVKGEMYEGDDYIMVFAPVKDRTNVVLEVGQDIKIPLGN